MRFITYSLRPGQDYGKIVAICNYPIRPALLPHRPEKVIQGCKNPLLKAVFTEFLQGYD
jgi:hypothetical protein